MGLRSLRLARFRMTVRCTGHSILGPRTPSLYPYFKLTPADQIDSPDSMDLPSLTPACTLYESRALRRVEHCQSDALSLQMNIGHKSFAIGQILVVQGIGKGADPASSRQSPFNCCRGSKRNQSHLRPTTKVDPRLRRSSPMSRLCKYGEEGPVAYCDLTGLLIITACSAQEDPSASLHASPEEKEDNRNELPCAVFISSRPSHAGLFNSGT